MKLNFEGWLYGLFAAAIGGAATAGFTWVGMGAAHMAGADVPMLNFKALLVVLISGAAPNFFNYLRQSPLPPMVTETTTTVTVKQTQSATDEKPHEKVITPTSNPADSP